MASPAGACSDARLWRSARGRGARPALGPAAADRGRSSSTSSPRADHINPTSRDVTSSDSRPRSPTLCERK